MNATLATYPALGGQKINFGLYFHTVLSLNSMPTWFFLNLLSNQPLSCIIPPGHNQQVHKARSPRNTMGIAPEEPFPGMNKKGICMHNCSGTCYSPSLSISLVHKNILSAKDIFYGRRKALE